MRLRVLYHLPCALAAIVVFVIVAYRVYKRTDDGFQAVEAAQASVVRNKVPLNIVSHLTWLVLAILLIFNL